MFHVTGNKAPKGELMRSASMIPQHSSRKQPTLGQGSNLSSFTEENQYYKFISKNVKPDVLS